MLLSCHVSDELDGRINSMIVCPNCNHSNPDGATQCEACYTPLPATTSCPNCGAPVQADAAFCGQCGSNLHSSTATQAEPTVATDIHSGMPNLVSPDPLVQPEPLVASTQASSGNSSPSPPDPTPVPPTAVSVPNQSVSGQASAPPPPPTAVTAPPVTFGVASSTPPAPLSPPLPAASSKTQLQQQKALLLHVQTDTTFELLQNLSVIHIGKPNDRIPPDVDVSGFPNSEIVSRIHADIRVEGDAYYIEDVGSSNGTYINNKPLAPGNRHRLRAGDRITLGKGDLVSFLFQLS